MSLHLEALLGGVPGNRLGRALRHIREIGQLRGNTEAMHDGRETGRTPSRKGRGTGQAKERSATSSNSLERVIRVGVPSAGLQAVPMAAVNIARPASSYRMNPLNDGMNSGAGHAQVFRSGVMQKRRIVVGREGCNG